MRVIFTTKRDRILVDDEDYDRLNQYTWWLDKDGYAVARIRGKTVRMHRLILRLRPNSRTQVDHQFGNKRDNRKAKLRKCTVGQNNHNRVKRKDNTSGYKGVNWDKATGRWKAKTMFQRKAIFIGYFDDPAEAHRAYCRTIKKLHREFANPG